MRLHVVRARALRAFRLEVTFSDGRSGTVDLVDELDGPVFEPLRDPWLFSGLHVDPELKTVVWPNGADLAPEFHYFLAFRDDAELVDQFRQWGYVP